MSSGSLAAVALAPEATLGLVREPLTLGTDTFAPTSRRSVGGKPARVGVIGNPRSRRNLKLALRDKSEGDVLTRTPGTQQALVEALRQFAARRVDLLVIDGGDGTVRDVLTAAPTAFGSALPPIAVIPSGKTNALALDLGIPANWTTADARAALAANRVSMRSPVEIICEDATILRGFLFGAGGFVRATELAQSTHAVGAFGGVAVGLSLVGALAQTAFGRIDNPWRTGERIKVTDLRDGASREERLYLLLGSTMRRLPLGLRPLGRNDAGLNILAVQAPPRLLALTAPAILAGQEGGWLRRAGYHHCHDTPPLRLELPGGFVLDGEAYAPQTITVRSGTPIRFVTP